MLESWCLEVSIAMTDSMTKSNLGGIILAYMSQLVFMVKGSQGRKSRQEPGSRNWSRDHGEAVLTGLLPVA